MIFKGSGVALCTPFTDTGINFDTLERLIEYQIDNGTDAIIVCGTTGEPATMTDDEQKSIIEFTVSKVNGKLPVIAGIGGNNTQKVLSNAQSAQNLGADGVLAVTPYYNKCTPAGLYNHFSFIADNVDIPVIVYNVPSRTGVNLTPDVFSNLAEHQNIAAIKEASANISQISEYARVSEGKADIYSGNDDQVIPILSLGGIGVISVAANIIPRYMHDMVDLYLKGDNENARKMQLKGLPLINALFSEVNPIPVKTALRLLGYDMGELRAPLCEMETEHLEALITEMKKFNLME